MENEWYKIWFSSKFYLELYSHRNSEDAQNLINLVQRTAKLPPDSSILDVCCGAGRHSLEFARRGFKVTGFDLSSFLISRAENDFKSMKEKNLKAKFLIKDMRYFNFRNTFDMAVNLFTSFGYFKEDNDNFSLFRNVSSSLKKNGYFVFDFLNAVYLKKNLIKTSKSIINSNTVIQKRRIVNDFVIKDIFIKFKTKEYIFSERLKLYTVDDFRKIFKKYDLKIIKICGDYFGNDFDIEKSKRIVIFAKKY